MVAVPISTAAVLSRRLRRRRGYQRGTYAIHAGFATVIRWRRIAGPIVVRGAKHGDVVAIDLIELTPFWAGKSAILRDFGILRRHFAEPVALSSPVSDGRARFGGRIPLPLNLNLGTISTMPPEGYKPSYAGAYGGDFDQKDAGQGSRIFLPVLVDEALVFLGDPHAEISDGIIPAPASSAA